MKCSISIELLSSVATGDADVVFDTNKVINISEISAVQKRKHKESPVVPPVTHNPTLVIKHRMLMIC